MTRFYLVLALRSLWRGGQRSLLALFCIAFAVLSLVSMLILAGIVRDATVIPPRAELGGDFTLTRGRALTGADVAELAAAQTGGQIRAFTLLAPNLELSMARKPGSGRVFFLSRAFGVDAATFPLLGSFDIVEPAGATVRSALRQPGAVIVTRDAAQRMGLAPGDTVLLGGTGGAAAAALQVSAIAATVPDRKGDSMFFDLATARIVAGHDAVVYSASVLGSEDAAEMFRGNGWTVRLARDVRPGAAGRVFDFMLKGAGLLGLLLGGIGVANTLTVALARRTQEIAVLKTIGYRRRDLLALLGTETVLLGVFGSLLGGLLALLVARQLMGLLDATEGSLLLAWHAPAGTVIGGMAAGIISTVVFGAYATLRASSVRPALLLRQAAPPATPATRLTLLTALLVAGSVFALLGSAIMGSVLRGVGVIAAGSAGLLVLGAFFAFVLTIVLKLPLPGPLLTLARRNLQHQRGRAIVAVVALFVGSFTVGFASSVTLSARERVLARRASDEGTNLRVHAPLQAEASVSAALRRHALTPQLAIALNATASTAQGLRLGIGTLEGRSTAPAVMWVSGGWSDQPDALHLPAFLRSLPGAPALGDRIEVRSTTGSTQLHVRGYFEPGESEWSFGGPLMLAGAETARRLGGSNARLAVSAAVPTRSLQATTAALGSELPSAMVISKSDFNDLLVRAYTSLFTFVAALAGLAFLAGALLIANAVGLALIERKRELGILKAIGYNSRHVLGTILIENAILGALAGLSGVAAVRAVGAFTNFRFTQARLELGSGTAAALFLLSLSLALLAALLVAWRPSRSRPLAVLRQD